MYHKRITGQRHLVHYKQPTYRKMPLLNCKHGFVEQYLNRLYKVLLKSTRTNAKVFAVRVDLRFPDYYRAPLDGRLSNDYLHRFFRFLRLGMQDYKVKKARQGIRVQGIGFQYAWAREYGPESGKPHFHILLFFNGQSFRSVGRFDSEVDSLYTRLGEAWANALGLHVGDGGRLISFPERGQQMLLSSDDEAIAWLFCRSSYLAKVESKDFHEGYHVFGSSRLGKDRGRDTI